MITQHHKWLEACRRMELVKAHKTSAEREWEILEAEMMRHTFQSMMEYERDCVKHLLASAEQLKEWSQNHDRMMAQ